MHESGSDCVGSSESILHKIAKEILEKEKKIMLPPLPNKPPQMFICTEVVSEMTDKDTGLRPDCVCYNNDYALWVEFKRTHEVKANKTDIIKKAHKNCIEVDISDYLDKDVEKQAFRDFIVNSSNKRIWVYNDELKITKSAGRERVATDYEETETKQYMVFAYDEDYRIINARSIDKNSVGNYYCISCRKKLKLESFGCFTHIEKGCDDKSYLVNSAAQILYNKFYQDSEFFISIPGTHYCVKKEVCPFYDEEHCSKTCSSLIDIKGCGYTVCDKREYLPGESSRSALIFHKPGSMKDAIAVDFHHNEEDCETIFEEDAIQPKWRHISVDLENENSLHSLRDHGLQLISTLPSGFIINTEADLLPKDLRRNLYRFTMFESGRHYIEEVSCHECSKQRPGKVVKEFLGVGEKEYVEAKSLMECKKLGIKGFYCKICYHLMCKIGSPICNRYKTKGTPQFPLQSKPVNCEFFNLNKQIENIDDVIIEPNFMGDEKAEGDKA